MNFAELPDEARRPPPSDNWAHGTGSYQVVVGSVDGSTYGAYTVTDSFSFSFASVDRDAFPATGGSPASASAIAPLLVSIPEADDVATPDTDTAATHAKHRSPVT